MKFILGECYAITKFYEGIVEISEEDEIIKIEATIITNTDENINEYISEILITNSEDLPHNIKEEEIIIFIKENCWKL